MGRALCEAYPVAAQVFAEADEALSFALSRLCFEGPESELKLTANAQPAILTTSIAALRALYQEKGLRPDVVAGHSLGEYSALVAAGALDVADAVRVVHLRGTFMQEAVAPGQGSMAAILGLEAEAVFAICKEIEAETGQVVSPANLNGGGQIVIAGHAAAVDAASKRLKERGAKRAVALQVSAPFHCALMAPAAERLAAELGRITFRAPAVPVVSNVEATANQDPGRIGELLTRQVTAPVRWEESVRELGRLGVTRAVEVGAGNVLAGLVRRIAPEMGLAGASDPDSIRSLET